MYPYSFARQHRGFQAILGCRIKDSVGFPKIHTTFVMTGINVIIGSVYLYICVNIIVILYISPHMCIH